MARILDIGGNPAARLEDGWEMAILPPGAVLQPAGLPATLRWLPARVPGTAATALRDAGLWDAEAPTPLHGNDIWYRRSLHGEGTHRLHLDGLATLAELWLDDECLLRSESMFVEHAVPLSLSGHHQIHLCFRAIAPRLAAKGGRRARWRAPMIATPGLRGLRTTLLGHMPGWCPAVDAVGPWRAVTLVRPGRVDPAGLDLRLTLLPDGTGEAQLRLELHAALPGEAPCWLEIGGHRTALHWRSSRVLEGHLRIPGIAPWWPHTHGTPTLHAASLNIAGTPIALAPVGFRRIEVDRGTDGRGFQLMVNGVAVFCRGACWTSADLLALPAARPALEPWLMAMRDAGMNMVRIPGSTVYEADAFHALCDAFGILVWQDFMFANLDYPVEDPAFAALVEREVADFLRRSQASPSLAVLCGGSEVAQQAAMMGLPPERWTGALFDTLLPRLCAELRDDVPYVVNSPSAPPGREATELPFATDGGIAHYFGVGAYRRDFGDLAQSRPRFAAECLAFANLPGTATLAEPGMPPPGSNGWKRGIPRDAGADWDFEDIREHYRHRLHGTDQHPDTALATGRAAIDTVMETAFAAWRSPGSGCGGALVWTLQDLAPGAGWGVIDAFGRPKSAWYALRRAFRPVKLLLIDQGLNGLMLHLVNETPRPLRGRLALACLREGRVPVCHAERMVEVPAQGAISLSATSLFGGFFDATRAYRFGPAEHDVTEALLSDAASGEILAAAFQLPGRLERAELGLAAALERQPDGWGVTLRSRHFAQSVQIEAPGFVASDLGFHLSPGRDRTIHLRPDARQTGDSAPMVWVSALNAADAICIMAPST